MSLARRFRKQQAQVKQASSGDRKTLVIEAMVALLEDVNHCLGEISEQHGGMAKDFEALHMMDYATQCQGNADRAEMARKRLQHCCNEAREILRQER